MSLSHVVAVALLLFARAAVADPPSHDRDGERGSQCHFSTPEVLNIFGAKPPRYLIFNASSDYLACQQPLFRVLPVYRPIDLPDAVSADGIEMVLRGFGDVATSGRFIAGSDLTKVGCSASLVNNTDGSTTGPCNGRIIRNTRFVKNILYFTVHSSNPVRDITTAQLSTAVNAILAGSPVTWSQLFPSVTFPGTLGSETINVLNGPPGGGLPVAVSKSTGVPVSTIPALSTAAISSVQLSTVNWLSFSAVATAPTFPVNVLTFNGLAYTAPGYVITDFFHLIYDINSPRYGSIKDFICYLLQYSFDGSVYNVFPLDSATAAVEKSKFGCPSRVRCNRDNDRDRDHAAALPLN